MNWSGLGKKVADVAPLLGTALGGPVGTGIGSVVAAAFGSGNNPDDIAKAIDADINSHLKLKELQLTHKQKLEEIALETTRAELQDKQSARTAHKDSNMPAAVTIVMSLLATLYGVGLFFVEFPDSNRDMINYFGGQMITLWVASVVYWVGTTRSSSDKTKLLSSIKQ